MNKINYTYDKEVSDENTPKTVWMALIKSLFTKNFNHKL